MCQYKSEGGRRCAIHRQDSLTAVNVATAQSGLEREDVEKLFVELRREGRGEGRSSIDAREWSRYLRQLSEEVSSSADTQSNHSNIQKAREGAINAPDKTTFYALTRISERARERSESLQNELVKVASETKRPLDKVEEQYKAVKKSVSKGDTPKSYTDKSVISAQSKNLPATASSIEALHQISSVKTSKVPNVTRTPVDSSTVSEAGYDAESGRVEMVLKTSQQAVSYKDVSPSEWSALKGSNFSHAAISKFSSPEHQYENAHEDKVDSHAVQCPNCGQFAALSHQCPDAASTSKEVLPGVPHIVKPENRYCPVSASEMTAEQQQFPFLLQRDMEKSGALRYTLPDGSAIPQDAQEVDREDLKNFYSINVPDGVDENTAFLVSYTPENTTFICATFDKNEVHFMPNYGVNSVPAFYTGEVKRYDSKNDNPVNRQGSTNERAHARNYRNNFVQDNATNSIRVKTVNDAAKAFKEYDAVVVRDFKARIPSFNELGEVKNIDEQGYQLPFVNNSYGSSGFYPYSGFVAGTVLFKKDENGKISVDEKGTGWACACSDYRQYYRCPHVNYAMRHAPSMVKQNMDSESYHPLLSKRVAKMPQVEVVGEEGKEHIKINNGGMDRHEKSVPNRNIIVLPKNSDPRNLTFEDIQYIKENENSLNITTAKALRDSDDFRRALACADVEVPITATSGGADSADKYKVEGDLRFKKQPYANIKNPTVVSHSLKCTCPEYAEKYDCPHVRDTVNHSMSLLDNSEMSMDRSSIYETDNLYKVNSNTFDIYDDVVKNGDGKTQEELSNEFETRKKEADKIQASSVLTNGRAVRRVNDAEYLRERRSANISVEDQRKEEEDFSHYRNSMQERWKNVEEGYSDDPEKFYNDYMELEKKKEFDYKYENVLDGSGTGPGARKFGVELEFVIDTTKSGASSKQEALNRIAKELHSEGLTENDYMGYYHSGQVSGWSHWNLESDCTVDGELVSPLLSDTPEDWKQLEKVCEILKRHGGKVNKKVGSHVHVSSGSYGFSHAKHAALTQDVAKSADVMYRVSKNPSARAHRKGAYCIPNIVDNQEITNEESGSVGIFHAGHGMMLNVTASGQVRHSKSHVEFRMWDGTLDPGVIQRQVQFSVAMTDRAERNVMNGVHNEKKVSYQDGDGNGLESALLKKEGLRKHNPETLHRSSAPFISMVDTLFRKQEDRKSMLQLFARNKWSTK